MTGRLAQRTITEGLGTAFLLVAIVGSGIMAQRLSGADLLAVLFVNAAVTGLALTALIVALGPISGAHFNPLITLHMGLQGVMPWREVPAYVLAQLSGGVIGVACANAMFGLPLLAVSQHSRAGPGLLLGEAVATFGLLMIVWYGWQGHAPLLPVSVGAYIAAAIMFTSSTSFANPAVTIARSLSDSFAGIAPHHVFAFVLAQLAGALAAVAVAGWLAKRTEQ